MKFFNDNWCELSWTPWMRFTEPDYSYEQLQFPGIYRVRKTNGGELFYIGETGRSLKARMKELIDSTQSVKPPYNDPHTAAPHLWAWKKEEGIDFAISAAQLELPKHERKAFECFLLWQYRLEKNESTICNHGRFHRFYQKPGNKPTTRNPIDKPLRRLPEGEINPNSRGSFPPKRFSDPGRPLENNWMGLEWSGPQLLTSLNQRLNTPSSSGVYKLIDPDAQNIIYIGEANNLKKRLATHARQNKAYPDRCFSYCEHFPNTILKFQLHEIENDLIAGYYYYEKRIPILQFIDYSNSFKTEELDLV